MKNALLGFIATIILFLNTTALADNEKLSQGIYSISSIEDENFKELKLIGELVGHSKYVALGEAHHTSDGFYQAKFHMIQYLIKERGFRAIAFENNWDTLLPVDDFLVHGTGGAKSALLNFYPVWRADTVLRMLNWIRKFNQENPEDPVRIFGFDMQNLEASSKYIIHSLESKGRTDFTQEISTCNNTLPYFYNEKVQDSDCEKCSALSSKLLESADTFQKEFPYFQVAALSLQSNYLRSCAVSDEQELITRDETMAKILPLMAEQTAPHAKAIIWAANGHIHKKSLSPNAKSMGEVLAQQYADDYKTILLIASTYETHKDFDFIEPQLTAPPGSLEEWLETFGKEYLFVDFHKVPKEILELKEDDENIVLQDTDGIFYLKHSDAMILVK
jgi:erythromycin esterase-like protein